MFRFQSAIRIRALFAGFRITLRPLAFCLLMLAISLAGCRVQVEAASRPTLTLQTALPPEAAKVPDQPARTPVPAASTQPQKAVAASPDESLYHPPLESLDPLGRKDCSEVFPEQVQLDCQRGDAAFGSGPDLISIGRRARGQIELPAVPMVDQENDTACGEAAFAMGWNDQHPGWSLEVETIEKTGLNLGVYFPSPHPGPGGYLGTSPAGMAAIGDFFADKYKTSPPTVGNLNLDNGDAYAQLEAIGLLDGQLSNGYPVIVEVTDVIGEPSRTYNDSHYVLLTGMDFDMGRVTYNDPYIHVSMSGKYSGFGRVAEWSAIWASWSGNRDVNPGKSGHPGRGWFMIVH